MCNCNTVAAQTPLSDYGLSDEIVIRKYANVIVPRLETYPIFTV